MYTPGTSPVGSAARLTGTALSLPHSEHGASTVGKPGAGFESIDIDAPVNEGITTQGFWDPESTAAPTCLWISRS